MGDDSTDGEPFADIEDAFEEMAEVDEEMVDEPVDEPETGDGDSGAEPTEVGDAGDDDTESAGTPSETEADEASETEDELEASVGDAENVVEVEADDVETEGKQVITGGEFECELALDRATTAAFLRDLAHQVETGTTLTVAGDGWEIPFEYAEPIEVEVEHEGAEDGEPRELEIEIEFNWRDASDHLAVR